MQKAGRLLEVRCPRTVTYHGGEHVVALWFASLAKIPEIKVWFFMFHCSIVVMVLAEVFCFSFQLLILKVCRCYNVISSRLSHSLYAIFVRYAVMKFGYKVTLLRGAGT